MPGRIIGDLKLQYLGATKMAKIHWQSSQARFSASAGQAFTGVGGWPMMGRSQGGFAMNNPLIIVTVAFLLLLPQFNKADAAGPYDGEWRGTATSTGERCKRAVVNVTVEGKVVMGQAQFSGDTSNINGTVDESGVVGATIGFQFLRGQFTGNEFEATFKSLDCQWEALLRRTTAGDGTHAASGRLKGQ